MEKEIQIRAHKQKRLNRLARLEGEAIVEIQKKMDKANSRSWYALLTLKKLGWKKESEVLHDDIASDFYVEIVVIQKQMKHKYYKVIPHEQAMYQYN